LNEAYFPVKKNDNDTFKRTYLNEAYFLVK
jgi:hypothetical protein